MSQYRYILEKGSKKHRCPACHKKRFVRYVDTQAEEYLPIEYGRCDREAKCSYFLNPYADGYGKNQNDWKPKRRYKPRPKPQPKPETVFFPVEVFQKTLDPNRYEQNQFIQNLQKNGTDPFDIADINKVVEQYFLGTITKGYRSGAITFPFIDKNHRIRTIQVKQFDKTNSTTGTDFLHSIIEKHYQRKNKPLPGWLDRYLRQDKKVSCMFGEHLLTKYPQNPVAIVEAPKTAIYGNLYFGFPDDPKNLLWLAVYNLSSLNLEKVKPLKGRNVILFPDLSSTGHAFKDWSKKANQFEKQLPGTIFKVSDLIERLAPQQDREKGNDIADFLIKMDWRDFRKQANPSPEPKPNPEPSQKQVEAIPDEPNKLKKNFSLQDLANNIIGQFNNERQSNIILKLMELTGVNEKRAENGFNLMLKRKIISLGIADRYYLTGSTPF